MHRNNKSALTEAPSTKLLTFPFWKALQFVDHRNENIVGAASLERARGIAVIVVDEC